MYQTEYHLIKIYQHSPFWASADSIYTQNIGVQKISQKPIKVTKSWLIDLVSWTNLGSQFGGDESDELA